LPRASELARSGRLLASAGSRVESSPTYVDSAVVPLEPWRCLTDAEIGLLCVDASAQAGATLDVLSPRTASSRELARRVLEMATQHERGAASLVELKVAASELLLSLSASFGGFELASELRFAHVDPNLATVTRDPSQNQRLLGLHVDNHERRAIRDRAASQRLLSLNLSSRPRSLLFVDLQLIHLEQLLDRARATPAELHNTTDLGRAFLRQNSDYPVLRLVLHPGEAYLAPVQNMVHDGSTLDMERRDLTLRAFGELVAARRSVAV